MMSQKKQFVQIDILGTNQTPMDAYIYTDEESGQSFEFYEVTLSGGKFYHKDEELNYAKLLEKFNDNNYFLYLKHLNLIFIPSIETDDALAFSVAWTRREEAGDYEYPQPYISRVIINTDEVVRSEQTGCQATDLMLDSYDDYEDQYGEKMYPSAKAVKDLVDSSSGGGGITYSTPENILQIHVVQNEKQGYTTHVSYKRGNKYLDRYISDEDLAKLEKYLSTTLTSYDKLPVPTMIQFIDEVYTSGNGKIFTLSSMGTFISYDDYGLGTYCCIDESAIDPNEYVIETLKIYYDTINDAGYCIWHNGCQDW